MKLYKEEDPVIDVDGIEYKYRADFRSFLKVNAVLKDDEIIDEDKLSYVDSFLFFGESKENTVKCLKAYMEHYGGKRGGKKVFDMEQDSEAIYASFMQCYKIDLFTAELSTEQFLALLRGLPKGCRLSEIIEIRNMEVPPATKTNAKARQSIMEAKKAVALKIESDNPFGEFGKAIAELAKAGHNE